MLWALRVTFCVAEDGEWHDQGSEVAGSSQPEGGRRAGYRAVLCSGCKWGHKGDTGKRVTGKEGNGEAGRKGKGRSPFPGEAGRKVAQHAHPNSYLVVSHFGCW